VTGGNHLALGVIEVLHRVADNEGLRVGALEGVPDDIKPIAVAKLSRLVPLS